MVRAEFFDIFGFFVFLIILVLGIKILKSNKKIPHWIGGALLLIGIGGALIDGIIVLKTYFLGN